MRTSTWLGNNHSNFDYMPSSAKRAIGSFKWGARHFAIYSNEADASADLRERVAMFQTIGGYIRAHLGNNPKDQNLTPEDYLKFMKQAVHTVTMGDSTVAWTGIDKKSGDDQKAAYDKKAAANELVG